MRVHHSKPVPLSEVVAEKKKQKLSKLNKNDIVYDLMFLILFLEIANFFTRMFHLTTGMLLEFCWVILCRFWSWSIQKLE